MRFVANPFVALLDANVLFPFRIRDVLFTFAHGGCIGRTRTILVRPQPFRARLLLVSGPIMPADGVNPLLPDPEKPHGIDNPVPRHETHSPMRVR